MKLSICLFLFCIGGANGFFQQLSHPTRCMPSMILGGFGKKSPEAPDGVALSSSDRKWVEDTAVKYNAGSLTASAFVKQADRKIEKYPVAIQFAAEVVKDKKRKDQLLQTLEEYERKNNKNFRTAGIAADTIIGERYQIQASGTSKSSGKSRILNAVDITKPKSPSLKAKVSKDQPFIQREADNMKKLRKTEGGGQSKLFVDFYNVMYDFDGKGNHAIVMESGSTDLEDYVESKGPIRGSELRKIAIQVARILSAFHKAGLVWTDCKLDNLCFFSKGYGAPTVKAIDLESAVPKGQKLVSFSPEVCPPYAGRSVGSFAATYEYDSWALGMILYHLYTGQSVFKGFVRSQMIKRVKDAGNGVSSLPIDLNKINDKSLKSLLEILLEQNPEKVQPVTKLLRSHPYLSIPAIFSVGPSLAIFITFASSLQWYMLQTGIVDPSWLAQFTESVGVPTNWLAAAAQAVSMP
uniref:Protein kinase domain-containing protein n=1 Tax=Heterosigma akashiwo TaxID=2829 RepID=A0A6V3BQF4_HETAK|mmetsp:Transcript_32136/g.55466  ORF Transcript_32136/g.55466 Transcript_32136/m.55466 type:complete len:465 (+) Transcript_32136:86-1480(+)